MPLPIPKKVCEDIFINFTTNLPTIKEKSVIVVVVDILTKFYHLGALPACSHQK